MKYASRFGQKTCLYHKKYTDFGRIEKMYRDLTTISEFPGQKSMQNLYMPKISSIQKVTEHFWQNKLRNSVHAQSYLVSDSGRVMIVNELTVSGLIVNKSTANGSTVSGLVSMPRLREKLRIKMKDILFLSVILKK